VLYVQWHIHTIASYVQWCVNHCFICTMTHSATHCITLQLNASHCCITLQLNASHCFICTMTHSYASHMMVHVWHSCMFMSHEHACMTMRHESVWYLLIPQCDESVWSISASRISVIPQCDPQCDPQCHPSVSRVSVIPQCDPQCHPS